MKPDLEMQTRIKRYVLGETDEAETEAIEKMMLTDDELFEELLVIEDEVVDQYLARKLSPELRSRFEKYFLVTPERFEQLKFARAFDRYVLAHTASPSLKNEPAHLSQRWFHSFSSSTARALVFAVAVLVIGIGAWQFFNRQSDVERGLIALNAAYREERPLEARISNFDYAPFLTKRDGTATEVVDHNELNRAELTLLEALKKNPAPPVHHALGQVYLAKREFDKAIEQLDTALKSDPNNVQLYADLGAAWLEKGKLDKGADPGKGMEDLGRGLENLNKALEMSANSLEALFNRALCEEQLTLYSQAENDWREYLNRDSKSPWAEEARRRLQLLDEKKQRALHTKQDLFQSFSSAYEAENNDEAWLALSPSRGRTGNLIVESLLDELFRLPRQASNQEAAVVLQKISYAGEVEEAKVGDSFTRDLARTLRTANVFQRERIAEARELVKQAIGQYNKSEFSEAVEIFSKADRKVLEAGDECNHLFVQAWIGYCYLRLQESEKALQIFQRLVPIFASKNYKSMLAQALMAQADALNGKNEFSKVLERANEGLALSQQIQDHANSVRCLQASTSVQLIMGDYSASLSATLRALTLSEGLPLDPKITWPFYHEAALDFYFLGLPISAQFFEQEALRLATTAGLPLQASRSYGRLSLIQENLGEFVEAMKSSELARAEGQKITDQRTRTNVLAHSAMNLGRVYRETGDPRKAIASFDTALSLYQQLGMDIYRYQVHKGKTLALIQLGDNDAAQTELDSMIYWFEQNREKISEERFRNKFFDTEQDTYDLAVDFEYSRKNDGVKALDFAEVSRARSLHEMMAIGARFSGDRENPELKLTSVTPPLTATEIQSKLTEHMQLLEYSVLRDKTIIWVITRNSITPTFATITRHDLNQETEEYLQLLTRASPNRDDVTGQAKKLYAALVRPAEGYLNRSLQLCIIPDGKLNLLPFASLVSPDTGRYLIEDYTLQVAPSATVFITSSENATLRQPVDQERLLAVGNPRFADLPDLPSAKREADEIANLYKATALTGDAAMVRRVKSALTEADVVHFATHAVADDKSPMLSKLLLSADRNEMHHASSTYITAADIYQLKLNRTRLVVLSACQTGVERVYRGEGAIGLARPFIAAGVPLVVASLWPVESDATANLMVSFHKHRQQDHLSTVEALRRAQLEALHNPQSNSQYDWAAFVLIGGHADF